MGFGSRVVSVPVQQGLSVRKKLTLRLVVLPGPRRCRHPKKEAHQIIANSERRAPFRNQPSYAAAPAINSWLNSALWGAFVTSSCAFLKFDASGPELKNSSTWPWRPHKAGVRSGVQLSKGKVRFSKQILDGDDWTVDLLVLGSMGLDHAVVIT